LYFQNLAGLEIYLIKNPLNRLKLDFEFKKSQKFTTEKKKTLKRIGDFPEPLVSKCRVEALGEGIPEIMALRSQDSRQAHILGMSSPMDLTWCKAVFLNFNL
jgi:hypothetical protein